MSILRLKEVLKNKGVTGKELVRLRTDVTENAISMIINRQKTATF